ncbi:hypothetical protein EVAR_54024_1 [Eumeta japonica]|uniref:Uncharacterized protein n=1 Tax=Eumeta variegata TaxID=151549 RepID=A0A4C1XTT8_EUMVA|nr:hypothetical protein EVAR_54024_1 [Eumeta japonica]
MGQVNYSIRRAQCRFKLLVIFNDDRTDEGGSVNTTDTRKRVHILSLYRSLVRHTNGDVQPKRMLDLQSNTRMRFFGYVIAFVSNGQICCPWHSGILYIVVLGSLDRSSGGDEVESHVTTGKDSITKMQHARSRYYSELPSLTEQ